MPHTDESPVEFTTVRVRVDLKTRLDDLQDARRRADGKKTSVSSIISDALDAQEQRASPIETGLTPAKREDLRLYAEFLRTPDEHKAQSALRKIIHDALRGWYEMRHILR